MGAAAKPPLALHWRILLGLALGLALGLLLNATGPRLNAAIGDEGPLRVAVDLAIGLNGFVGDLFLRALRFIAVPIVLFSLVAGTSSLHDIQKLSRIGGKTIVLYLATTAAAISIGLLLANVVRPGAYVSIAARERLVAAGAAAASARVESAAATDVWSTILNVVPANPAAALAEGNMLQIVVLALAFGVGLTLLPVERAAPAIRLCEALTDAVLALVHLIMRAAPVAVFALLVEVVAGLGLDVLGALAVYSLVVVAGLAVMMLVVYPALLRFGAAVSPRRFFRAIAPAQVLAFSSSSSSATLPVTMECVEERLGVSEEVTSFVVPLGATLNMDGTALYQGVAAVFVTQLYGLELDWARQLTIVLTATLASIGTAGVPGVGIVMLVIVLQSIGVGPDAMAGGIAIILGVDRLLDMCRTACNVTGDCMVAAVVAGSEGELLSEDEVRRRLAAGDGD